MAFTDHSDLFGSVHEDGINRIVRHIMQQRPSLFNYATPAFHEKPELFCETITAAQSVIATGNPLFTEQKPLPILGAPVPIGLNFCLQLTDLEIDFHPTSVFDLPEELGSKLAEQRFALRAKACAGIDCPSDELIEQLIPILERLVVSGKRDSQDKLSTSAGISTSTAALSGGAAELGTGAGDLATTSSGSTANPAAASSGRTVNPAAGLMSAYYQPMTRSAMLSSFATINQPADARMVAGVNRDREIIALPTRELLCFCLELYIVGHFEWGTVLDPLQQWFKPRLDGIEIVDLQPTPMEDAIECYAATVMRLGILPRLILPMEVLVLDVTQVLRSQGLNVGKQITLSPSAVPSDVPNNPAIEEDMVKAFIKLTVTP